MFHWKKLMACWSSALSAQTWSISSTKGLRKGHQLEALRNVTLRSLKDSRPSLCQSIVPAVHSQWFLYHRNSGRNINKAKRRRQKVTLAMSWNKANNRKMVLGKDKGWPLARDNTAMKRELQNGKKFALTQMPWMRLGSYKVIISIFQKPEMYLLSCAA